MFTKENQYQWPGDPPFRRPVLPKRLMDGGLVPRSDLLHDQIRDHLEVPDIVSRHRVAEFQSGRADRQFAERDPKPSGLQIAVNLAGAQRDRYSNRFHRDLVQ
jgi:hypothetical protein